MTESSTGSSNGKSLAAAPETTEAQPPGRKRIAALSLAALGIVFGDIGTSPIYALRECFYGPHGIEPTPSNVLGVLSLIVWALILVVSVKYLLFVMRGDNHGEGGIVALVALLNPWRAKSWSQRHILMLLGLFGCALLYGDGTITPAISVLSAIEGLEEATPAFKPYVIPITLAILVGLFMLQKRGTAGIGALFGPVILLWFSVLGVLGAMAILKAPAVLVALNPAYAIYFFIDNGMAGFLVLGSVFLVVTGAETLYADMGHFGRIPIRLAWFALVLPALLLNYFGQGALILGHAGDPLHPFYQLAPDWAIYPLVGIATLATIIASQAVITGTFSLTRQLVQLGQLPRMNVVHTSHDQEGQIYVPTVNWLLMLATLGLVLGFKSSGALASAYGVAVATTMVITTTLAFFVARRFGWPLVWTSLLVIALLIVDLAFFGANLAKVSEGGWYPISVAALVFVVMTTWGRGRLIVKKHLAEDAESLEDLVIRLRDDPPHRVAGTAVFLTAGDDAPPRLLYHLDRHQVLHEHVILLTVETTDEPRVMASERLQVLCIAPGLDRITVRYGFMQDPNVPVALRLCETLGLAVDVENLTYYLGRETLIPSRSVPGMSLWREKLFAFLSRNATRATDFYRIPPEDVIELGFQIQI